MTITMRFTHLRSPRRLYHFCGKRNKYKRNNLITKRKRREKKKLSNYRDGDIDAEVAVVSEKLSHARVKHEAVRADDRGGNAFVDGPRCGFPREPASLPVEFESVAEILGLLPGTDQLDEGEKLLVPIELFLLFEDEHETVSEAGLHHHPVDCSRKVDVRREEDDVFALERRYGFV